MPRNSGTERKREVVQLTKRGRGPQVCHELREKRKKKSFVRAITYYGEGNSKGGCGQGNERGHSRIIP